jgi:phenylpyruvate tautomerase PptA (4-oxalocrotonate tautomerase family)
MPYLQLDVNGHHSSDDKRRLATKMSETYAEMMSVDIRRISIAIRELGDGGVWRIVRVGAPDQLRPVGIGIKCPAISLI